MMEKLAERIAKKQEEKSYLFIAVFAALALAFIPGIFLLVNNVEPSLEKVLPSSVEELQMMNYLRSQFGADMTYILIYAEPPVTDVRDPAFLRYVDSLSEKLRTEENVLEVQSIADSAKEIMGRLPTSYYQARNELRNPEALFASPDYSFTVVTLRTNTGSSAPLIKKLVNNIREALRNVEELNPGSRAEVTGFNAIDKATFEVIISDFSVITLLSMSLVLLIVLITFKSLAKALMPMLVVVNALITSLGAAGYLGLEMTVVSMVAAAMIIGLGIDFGIHVVNAYYNERRKHSSEQSLRNAMKELLRAMTGASFTTIAGFLSLLFGVVPAMKTLAVILAIGIFNTLLGASLLLPSVLYVYDKNRGG